MRIGDRQTYSEHAEEAARCAREATTGEERRAYERIAAVWRGLADAEGAADTVPEPTD
jgi:hypothetical protein